MSERSERVGRPSDAPPASGLATGAAAERATTTPPQDPPAPTIPQRSWPVYEGVRVRPPTTSVVGELDRERLHPEREDSPVSVQGRMRAAGPPEWWQWSLAWIDCREGGVCGARDGGQRAHCVRSRATAPTDKGDPPPTARYCCAAPALARRQQSLRSIDKPLRSFVAAGQGSLSMKVRRGSRGGCGCSSLYRTLGVG